MQLALRRRLRLPLPLRLNRCGPSPGCGGLVDVFGDHALACPRTGLLARRAKIVERAWVRVAREAVGADGQVVPQQWLCATTAPGVAPDDRRRLDSVIYGASPMGGALCCDATLVSPLTRTGQPQPADDGAMLRVAEPSRRCLVTSRRCLVAADGAADAQPLVVAVAHGLATIGARGTSPDDIAAEQSAATFVPISRERRHGLGPPRQGAAPVLCVSGRRAGGSDMDSRPKFSRPFSPSPPAATGGQEEVGAGAGKPSPTAGRHRRLPRFLESHQEGLGDPLHGAIN